MIPILVSSITIFAILSLEAFCLHNLPDISVGILYITTTLTVLFSFYATPYLVFNSLQNEKLAQKSLHEQKYMRRLVVIEIINILVIPIVFNILLVAFAPANYRDKD